MADGDTMLEGGGGGSGLPISPSTSGGEGEHSLSAPCSSGGSDAKLTPKSRRNKRKMTEPKRRTDFSIKRFCPDNSDDDSDISDTEESRSHRRQLEFTPHTPPDDDQVPSPTPDPIPGETKRLMPGTPHHHRKVSSSRGQHQSSSVFPTSTPVPNTFLFGAPPGGPASYPAAMPQIPMVLAHHHAQPIAMEPPPSPGLDGGKRGRKNYKNMTRERRVEANARERSRVHTISAAFESLRRAVPSYSYNQKLSKLAILRIACCYIMSLAKLADQDYSHDQSNMSFAECVDMCTRTIQSEGRARRRH